MSREDYLELRQGFLLMAERAGRGMKFRVPQRIRKDQDLIEISTGKKVKLRIIAYDLDLLREPGNVSARLFWIMGLNGMKWCIRVMNNLLDWVRCCVRGIQKHDANIRSRGTKTFPFYEQLGKNKPNQPRYKK